MPAIKGIGQQISDSTSVSIGIVIALLALTAYVVRIDDKAEAASVDSRSYSESLRSIDKRLAHLEGFIEGKPSLSHEQ